MTEEHQKIRIVVAIRFPNYKWITFPWEKAEAGVSTVESLIEYIAQTTPKLQRLPEFPYIAHIDGVLMDPKTTIHLMDEKVEIYTLMPRPRGRILRQRKEKS